MNMDKRQNLQKYILYLVMVAGLVWLYVTYVPFMMDYYVSRPEIGFFEFYQDNIVSEISEFEGVLLALILLGLWGLTGNSAVSVGILSVALMVLAHGSYAKYLNRKELLRLADLRLTEAAGMATEYLGMEFDSYLAVMLTGFLIFISLGVGIEVFRRKCLFRNQKILIRLGTTVIVGVVGIIYVTHFFAADMNMANADDTDLVNGAKNRHILYHFVKNDNLADISIEHVDESYEFLLTGTSEETMEDFTVNPNVIVIMNESWWNTDNADLSKLEISQNPMEPFNRLKDKCITGYLTSNVYGGGTVSSEAEFLTGINTKYYVSDSTVYEETMGRKLPSLVDYFKELNYGTTAIHPYYRHFYNRESVYSTMGFDELVFEDDMEYKETFKQYISDDSLVKEIIARYEENSEVEENQFIWAVSVANHRDVLEYGEGPAENYEYPITVKIKEGELPKREEETLVQYMNGIYLSGMAYEELITYFSEKEEPVIVVMFGDHIPNFSMDALELLGLTKKVDASKVDALRPEEWQTEYDEKREVEAGALEMLKRIYSVPVVMWSNIEMEEEPDFEGESIYYLPQMLLECAGLPDSEMSRILKCQRRLFRTNSRAFVTDAEGAQVLSCSEEQAEMLRHSKVVIYDILFGEEPRENLWSPIVVE